ncbi:replication initiator protein A [Telmatospirillum sp. J64-1]|uniref:replication initiator protein A n=1 Tax=Telmatospirillum sp. J64-1 TaxID=2502183 RepID=UPI002104FFE3|nr:replication initiator protein A [Telmatospirillum sp. J64-1]
MKTARPPATAASQTGSLKHTIDRLRETIERTAPRPSMRPAPANDNQPDFFVPSLCDIPVKDGIGLMDIAVFRLSKSQTRKGDTIRYELADAVVEVKGGADGMATVYDYDIVLMMISHLADAMRRYRAGLGEMPSAKFRPHSAEIFKFCRMPFGGRQYEALEQALDRLQGTYIKISVNDRRKAGRRAGYFPLIAGATVATRTDTGRVGSLEITIPDWIYQGVTGHQKPEILTVNADYFLIRKGLARFIYRLARKAAGTGEAAYSFETVHARCGTTRQLKKFAHELRQLIAANDLPDYELAEGNGKDGPLLLITSRASRAAA